uniref:Uncharacterized protein n=1 Tax=Novosphingobium aromaticivorans TaxID=48935 RepID=O85883_NOVAR|nr:unknown [Novosphingobium aromaticivorans]
MKSLRVVANWPASARWSACSLDINSGSNSAYCLIRWRRCNSVGICPGFAPSQVLSSGSCPSLQGPNTITKKVPNPASHPTATSNKSARWGSGFSEYRLIASPIARQHDGHDAEALLSVPRRLRSPGERAVVGVNVDLPEDLVTLVFHHAEVALAVRVVAGIDRCLVDQPAEGTLADHQVELPGTRIGVLPGKNIRERPREHGLRGHKRPRAGGIVERGNLGGVVGVGRGGLGKLGHQTLLLQ